MAPNIYSQDEDLIEAEVGHVAVDVLDERRVVDLRPDSPQTEHRVAPVVCKHKERKFINCTAEIFFSCRRKNGSSPSFSLQHALDAEAKAHRVYVPPLFLKWSLSFHIRGMRKSGEEKEHLRVSRVALLPHRNVDFNLAPFI